MAKFNTQDLKDILVSQGYYSQIDEALKAFLLDEGYSGYIHHSMYKWLGEQGYTGQYSERLKKWSEGGYPNVAGLLGAFSLAFSNAFSRTQSSGGGGGIQHSAAYSSAFN